MSEENNNTNLKEYIHLYVHCSVNYNGQDIKGAQMTINRREDKKSVVHIYMEYDSATKKEWNLTICDSTSRSREYCVKWNKPVRERQIPYDFTYMWNLMKKKINNYSSS